MSQFRSFEEMNVWKEARILIKDLQEISKKLALKKEFELKSQIMRAARSIAANIAEGNDSIHPLDFMRFLSFAKRSAAEVRAHLYDVLDENCINKEEFDHLYALTKKIGGMLAKLIQHLEKTNPTIKRIKYNNPSSHETQDTVHSL